MRIVNSGKSLLTLKRKFKMIQIYFFKDAIAKFGPNLLVQEKDCEDNQGELNQGVK